MNLDSEDIRTLRQAVNEYSFEAVSPLYSPPKRTRIQRLVMRWFHINEAPTIWPEGTQSMTVDTVDGATKIRTYFPGVKFTPRIVTSSPENEL